MREFLDILDEHFVNQMSMNVSVSKNERQYEDAHMTMIFTIYEEKNLNFPDGYVRIVMRNWEAKKSFSKNISLSFFNDPNSIIDNIKIVVHMNSGVEYRNMLNDWYELKKVELRDQKLNNLGI